MSARGSDNSQSRSARFRLKGNDLLSTLTGDLAPVLRSSRVLKIKDSYSLALQYAENKSEEASAHKNLSALHARLAAGTTEAWQKLVHWLDALLENIKASNLSRSMSAEWGDSLLDSRVDLIDFIRMVSRELPLGQELAWIQKWNQALLDLGGPKVKREELAIENGEYLLHRSIICMEEAEPPDYTTALTYIIEADRAVEIAGQG